MSGRGTIDIWVSKRMLRVGDSAISLDKITQIGVSPAPINLRPAFQNLIRTIFSTAVLTIIATFIVGLVATYERHIPTDAPVNVGALFAAAKPFYLIIELIALVPIVLAANTFRRELFNMGTSVLFIATSGVFASEIKSRDKKDLRRACDLIAKAIDDPSLDFHIQIANAHFGDSITQIGNGNTGKA